MSTLREDLEREVRQNCEVHIQGRTRGVLVELESLLDWLATTLSEEPTAPSLPAQPRRPKETEMVSDLTERIWSESAIAARPGQTARLEAIAREVEHLEARSADMEAQRDAASMRSGEWARRNWNASADMKARIRDAQAEAWDDAVRTVCADSGIVYDIGLRPPNPYRTESGDGVLTARRDEALALLAEWERDPEMSHEFARRLRRALLDAAPAGGAEAVETGWECGPHTNAWGGHDARCRRVSAAPSEVPHD